MLCLIVNASVLLLVLSLVWPALAVGHGDEEGIAFIGVDEARRLQESPRVVLMVDVRSAEEFQETRIKGAMNVPLTEIERRYAEIPRQGLVVLY